jgi:hypothetical protein
MAIGPLACATKERALAEPPQPTKAAAAAGELALTHASPEKGLSGTFSKGGVSVRFSCIRGERARDSLAGDPNAAPYMMALSITNVHGDLLVSSGQAQPEPEPTSRTPPEHREAELRLVVELGRAMQSAQLPPNVEPERQAIVQAAQATAAPAPPPPPVSGQPAPATH